MKAVDIVQSVLTRPRPHLLGLCGGFVLDTPVFLNSLSVAVCDLLFVVVGVSGLAGCLVSREVEFGNKENKALGANGKLGVGRELFHPFEEVDPPLAYNIIG